MEKQVVYARRWWTLGVLCLSTLIIGFDTTILNVALPTLVRSLAATAGQLQWIVDAYTLVFAGLLLTTGSLGDRFGRRLLLLLGLAVFALGSLLGSVADSAAHLIAVRALMGLGGALIMPSTLAVMTAVFPREERARAIAVWSAMAFLGIPLGPVIGGWLLDHDTWHAVFLVNLPVIAVAFVASLVLVPESNNPALAALDPLGAVLSVAGLAALLYAIIEAPTRGWTDTTILAAFVAAAVLLAAFVAWEGRCPRPLLDLGLFARPRFSAASLSIALVMFALMGALFFLTQYMQFVLGYSPFGVGVRIIPLTLGLALGAAAGTALVKPLGVRWVVAGGLAVVAGGLGVLATVTTTSGYGPVALALGVLGLGMGIAAPPATDLIMGAVPAERAGVGSAVNDTTQEVGGALGVAVLGSALAAAYGNALAPAVHGLSAPLAAAARNSLGAALQVAGRLGGSGPALRGAAQVAFVQAMSLVVLIGVGMALAGVLVAALFLPRAVETTPPLPGYEPGMVSS